MNPGNVRKILREQLASATVESRLASDMFDEATTRPTGLPHPDGVAHIQNLSKDYQQARKKLLKALTQLNDFTLHGIVPDDLKDVGGVLKWCPRQLKPNTPVRPEVGGLCNRTRVFALGDLTVDGLRSVNFVSSFSVFLNKIFMDSATL